MRFLVLVPAHNEEAVIGEICSDLLNQKYPGDLFRVLVIADNCCDSTARIVRKFECERLRVVERRSEIRGKGAALDYVLENKPRLIPGFDPDYVVIFDADNRVPEDFLGSLSVQAKGQAALQCNVKTKNPDHPGLPRLPTMKGYSYSDFGSKARISLGSAPRLQVQARR